MDNVIIADKYGKEIRTAIFSSYDFEVGNEENSFQLTIKRSEWEQIPSTGRIYIPGTEYGGLYRRLETNSKLGIVMPGGTTWRGMLKRKIIQPNTGDAYAVDSGELNAIIRRRISAAFPTWKDNTGTYPSMIVGSTENTGKTVTNWRYERYCTLLDGLEFMLNQNGYRLNIEYDQIKRAAVVSAVPIVDYSQDEEFSNDMRMDFVVRSNRDDISHLICLGQGELQNRQVMHIYRDGAAIYMTNPFPNGGIEDIQEVYDYAGAEYQDLYNAGVERLKEIVPETYEIMMEGSRDVAIGDIVGGRDYLTGYYLTAPVSGKIVRWEKGFRNITYVISQKVERSTNSYIPEEDDEGGEPVAEPVEE